MIYYSNVFEVDKKCFWLGIYSNKCIRLIYNFKIFNIFIILKYGEEFGVRMYLYIRGVYIFLSEGVFVYFELIRLIFEVVICYIYVFGYFIC